MSAVHSVYSFLRWRLVPVRYAGKLATLPRAGGAFVPRSALTDAIERDGHHAGPRVAAETLAQMQAIYRPRMADVTPTTNGHPFTNLVRPEEDFTPENPVFRHALSPQVLDVAHDYFNGRFVLDSIQVLYSWPTRSLSESQMWHKDYGDSRTLHCMTYLNDVTAPEDGPFVYIDKADTRRIRRAPFIRRIDDTTFRTELGSGQVRQFVGPAGESVFVDPSTCYHYGSRCVNPRLAIFVTFNTDRPFVAPTEPIRQHRERILAAARPVRPELSDTYLRRLLQL